MSVGVPDPQTLIKHSLYTMLQEIKIMKSSDSLKISK